MKNLQESIRKVLREGGYIPSPIMRRISNDDLEEAFDYALETNATSMDNPNSVIFKEKKPSLWVFSKFVIDDMVTLLEQEYFNDDNRIYFSDTEEDDKTYHEKIRQPLLRHYGKRIKEKYYEVMSSNDEEIIQESIRRVLREETNVPLSFRRRITNSDIEEEFLKALDSIDYSRLHNQFSPIKNISLKTFAKLVIDEMYMYLEKDYFSDEDSLLFDDDKIYHEKIRVPLMNYFGDRIKKRYNGNNINESESIRRVLSESINKSDEKRNKLIKKIMDNIIFTEYNHIICGYDVKNDEVFNKPVVNVTFIGGYGTKLWPVTQGIQKMYSDILDEIWNTIYDYINIPVGVTMNTTTKCDEQENIYLRESVDKSKDKKD